MRKSAMKCRIHPSDPGAGVCPLCLRERLSALAAAEDADRPLPASNQDPENPPFAPQEHHSTGCAAAKFSLFSPIWSNPSSKKGESNSWQLLALILRLRGRNQKKSPSPAAEIDRGRSRKPHLPPVNGRGMSPATTAGVEEGGYTTEPSPGGRFIPTLSPLWRAQSCNLQQHGARGLSSFVLCLSPLVRPSPDSRRSMAPPDKAPGELRGTFNRRSSVGGRASVADSSAVLAPNRSRKLVDLGKVW